MRGALTLVGPARRSASIDHPGPPHTVPRPDPRPFSARKEPADRRVERPARPDRARPGRGQPGAWPPRRPLVARPCPRPLSLACGARWPGGRRLARPGPPAGVVVLRRKGQWPSRARDARSSSSTRSGSRGPGTTSRPTCPVPPEPVLHPGTRQPIGPQDLAPLFPMALIGQVVSKDREIEIPEPVRDAYRLYRPSPLFRAHRLEKALDTPAHIYYKYEGGSPSGSHKPNTALAQAYYNKAEGATRLATETGAGQWGSALAFAGAVFGLEVKVYMVRASYDQKPYRRMLMETYGAEVVASPSLATEYGRKVLGETPDNTGSLGIAISEAIEDTVTHPGTKYSLGSVFDFVLLHQTVIGQETILQMELAGEEPDVIIGCAGGGSNFAGPVVPVARPVVPRRSQVPGHRGRAGGGPEPDPRRLHVRLRRHRPDDAAGQDAHPRPRLHPGADPRRWAALPRHGSARVAAQGARLHRGPKRPPAGELRVRRSASPGPRASCPRRSRPTRSRSRSTRRWRRRRPAGRRSSCSTCAATVTSTWQPTIAT